MNIGMLYYNGLKTVAVSYAKMFEAHGHVCELLGSNVKGSKVKKPSIPIDLILVVDFDFDDIKGTEYDKDEYIGSSALFRYFRAYRKIERRDVPFVFLSKIVLDYGKHFKHYNEQLVSDIIPELLTVNPSMLTRYDVRNINFLVYPYNTPCLIANMNDESQFSIDEASRKNVYHVDDLCPSKYLGKVLTEEEISMPENVLTHNYMIPDRINSVEAPRRVLLRVDWVLRILSEYWYAIPLSWVMDQFDTDPTEIHALDIATSIYVRSLKFARTRYIEYCKELVDTCYDKPVYAEFDGLLSGKKMLVYYPYLNDPNVPKFNETTVSFKRTDSPYRHNLKVVTDKDDWLAQVEKASL